MRHLTLGQGQEDELRVWDTPNEGFLALTVPHFIDGETKAQKGGSGVGGKLGTGPRMRVPPWVLGDVGELT